MLTDEQAQAFDQYSIQVRRAYEKLHKIKEAQRRLESKYPLEVWMREPYSMVNHSVLLTDQASADIRSYLLGYLHNETELLNKQIEDLFRSKP